MLATMWVLGIKVTRAASVYLNDESFLQLPLIVNDPLKYTYIERSWETVFEEELHTFTPFVFESKNQQYKAWKITRVFCHSIAE